MYQVERCLLLDLLRKRGMTQTDLADLLGIPKQRINEYVNDRHVMPYNIAYSISKTIHCDMADLYKMSVANNE